MDSNHCQASICVITCCRSNWRYLWRVKYQTKQTWLTALIFYKSQEKDRYWWFWWFLKSNSKLIIPVSLNNWYLPYIIGHEDVFCHVGYYFDKAIVRVWHFRWLRCWNDFVNLPFLFFTSWRYDWTLTF